MQTTTTTAYHSDDTMECWAVRDADARHSFCSYQFDLALQSGDSEAIAHWYSSMAAAERELSELLSAYVENPQPTTANRWLGKPMPVRISLMEDNHD